MPIDFFNFAGEIRNKVYEELLSVSEPIIIESGPRRLYMVAISCPYSAILLANKRANSEASPLLYSRNRFEFGIDRPGTKAGYKTERMILASLSTKSDSRTQAFSVTSASPSRPTAIITPEAWYLKKTAYPI